MKKLVQVITEKVRYKKFAALFTLLDGMLRAIEMVAAVTETIMLFHIVLFGFYCLEL
jgi:hypothetical protein